MKDDFEYKPRHGFDIRVKPAKGGRTAKKSWAKQDIRVCENEECKDPAEVRAAKSPHNPNMHIWLCATHAREHNKTWNFFEGMSDDEAKAFRESQRYGGRPTWKMAQNARAAAAAKANANSFANIEDAAGIFDEAAQAQVEKGEFRDGRKLTKLQVSAFKTFNLPTNATEADIRKRYAELVKRFHPDSNDGDRGAEEQLQEVIKSHQILKNAGYC